MLFTCSVYHSFQHVIVWYRDVTVSNEESSGIFALIGMC